MVFTKVDKKKTRQGIRSCVLVLMYIFIHTLKDVHVLVIEYVG